MFDPSSIIVPTVFFLCVLAIWGAFILTRHKERLTIMEKGLNPEEIRALYTRTFQPWGPLSSLKWGIVLVAIGVAVLLAIWLRENTGVPEGVFPGLIAVFGGLGLVSFYFIARRKMN